MDILKYMGSLEIEAKDEEQLSRFLNEKESEIKGSILALWKEFSAENTTVLENKDEVLINEESSTRAETTDVVKEDLINEDENKSVEMTVSNESILTQGAIILKNENKIKSEPEKIEQIKNKNTSSFELQIKNKSIIIPNGKVNQDYCYHFKIEELGLADIGDYWFEGLEAIGLAFASDTNVIKGKPIVAGEHKIKLKIKRNDWSDGKPIFERQITFIINPDPKSLWKNIPTPDDIEYYKPDSAICFVKVESTSSLFGTKKTAKKNMVAARQRGRSHAQ